MRNCATKYQLGKSKAKIIVPINLKQCGKHYLLISSLTFKKIVFNCFNENPLKVMRNAFYFMLKALFVLEIFEFLFCPDILIM